MTTKAEEAIAFLFICAVCLLLDHLYRKRFSYIEQWTKEQRLDATNPEDWKKIKKEKRWRSINAEGFEMVMILFEEPGSLALFLIIIVLIIRSFLG